MRLQFPALAALGLATMVGFTGLTAAVDTAEAGKKHRHGITIHLGDGYGHGHGYRPYYGSRCGWLYRKWQYTGNYKWFHRWEKCKYGW